MADSAARGKERCLRERENREEKKMGRKTGRVWGGLGGDFGRRREKWIGVEDELLARGREGWGCRWRSRGVFGWGIWTEGAIPRGKRESGGGAR